MRCVCNVHLLPLTQFKPFIMGTLREWIKTCATDGNWRLWLWVRVSRSQKPTPYDDGEPLTNGLSTTTRKVRNTNLGHIGLKC